jgi:hypothetical protein
MALLVFSVVLVCLAVAGLGLSLADWHARRQLADHDPHTVITPTLGMVAAAHGRDCGREEITLARHRISGELTPARYQRQMADLAAWDASTNPLIVPSDRGAWPA